MSITMTQMLESITDAISAMVIFAQEAGNNQAVMKNLAQGATGVASAVQYLVAQAGGTVGMWERLGSQEMATRMKENNDELTGAVNGLLNACRGVAENPKNIDAKNAILEEGKAIMKLMVGLIQYNDLYDVMVGLKQVNVAKDLLAKIFDDVFPADDYVVLMNTLSSVLERRFQQTHDTRAKQWLKECKEEIGELTVPLITLVKKSWEDSSYSSKISIVLDPMSETLEKCIKALKLSARSPFDLSMLDKAAAKQSGDDLDDVVLNFSNFQDGLAAVRKALADGDEFELDRAIRALERDINAQLDAAEDFANTLTDPLLKAALLAKVAAARQQLADIMARLAEEIPLALKTGDKSRVNRLLEQLEKLFNQVSEELALSEIQKAAASIDALLDEIPPAVDAHDQVETRALNKDVVKEVARQGAMAKIIAENCDDEFRKERILDKAGKMRDLTHDLNKASEESLRDDAKARKRLDEVIAEMKRHNKDLVTAATLSTPSELLEIASQIEANLVAAKKASAAGNVSGVNHALDEVGKNVARQAALAKAWAEKITDDPEKQKAIINAATLLGKEAGRLAANKASQEALLEGINKTSKANKDLINLAFESPDDELEALQGRIAADGERLKESVRGGNVGEAAHALSDAKSDVGQFNLLADIMGAEIEDEKVKDQLLKAQTHLTAQVAEMQPNTKLALKDYKLNMPKLEVTVGAINEDVKVIVGLASAGSPEDQMVKNADTMAKLGKRVNHEAEKGDGAKAASKSKDAARKVAKQNRLAKNVAARAEEAMPELAKKIVEETAKLEGLRKKMEDTSNKVAKIPSDATLSKEMKKAYTDFKDQADLTAQLARDIKNGKAAAEARRLEELRVAEEMRRREEEERERERQRKLSEMNIPKGPVIQEIIEAVVSMSEITDRYTVDNSAAGSLLELANRLGVLFQQLASLAKTGTKKDIIMKAREIAEIVKTIMKHVEDAASKCRDTSLNQEMRDNGNVTLNFATQLKIICSVKANLILEDDHDAANSLITCSRGICKTVGELVKLSQISKLKPK